MEKPTPDEAAAALDELATGRRDVRAADRRRLPLVLAAWSTLVFVDYAAKDHVRDKRVRWLITGACEAAALGVGMLDGQAAQVQPVEVGGASGVADVAPMGAAMAAWAVAERAIVFGLRRSGLRYPNTVAGAVFAVTRPLCYLGVQRLLPRPSTDV